MDPNLLVPEHIESQIRDTAKAIPNKWLIFLQLVLGVQINKLVVDPGQTVWMGNPTGLAFCGIVKISQYFRTQDFLVTAEHTRVAYGWRYMHIEGDMQTDGIFAHQNFKFQSYFLRYHGRHHWTGLHARACAHTHTNLPAIPGVYFSHISNDSITTISI